MSFVNSSLAKSVNQLSFKGGMMITQKSYNTSLLAVSFTAVLLAVFTAVHIFERSYRENASADGIGLALSKEIIELQNRTLHTENRTEGSGYFEVRFTIIDFWLFLNKRTIPFIFLLYNCK